MIVHPHPFGVDGRTNANNVAAVLLHSLPIGALALVDRKRVERDGERSIIGSFRKHTKYAYFVRDDFNQERR